MPFTTDIASPSDQRDSPPRTHFPDPHLSSEPAAGWADSSWNAAETRASNGVSSTRDTRISDDLMRPSDRSQTGAHTIDVFSGSARGPLKKPAWTNEELEGKYTPAASPKKSSLKSGSPDSDKRVHFSPTTLDAPPSPTRSNSPPKVYSGPESIYAPSPVANHVVAGYSPVPPPPPLESYIYAPSPHRNSPPRVLHPSAPPPPPLELTPEIIAKAQKRCRYAISALDYEDAETARKELREALALLEL